jgi:hypothetical protein
LIRYVQASPVPNATQLDIQPAIEALSPPVSVEVGHAYAEEPFGPEQRASCEVLRAVANRIPEPWNVTVLLDDYNAGKEVLSLDQLVQEVEREGFAVTTAMRESELLPEASALLDALPAGRLRSRTERYLERKGLYPCSLLSATWYSRRLISDPPAGSLLNIIPRRYEQVDRLALAILSAATNTAVDQIRPVLF